MKGCQAGRRFMVVRPDGLVNGCSMFPDLQYASRKEAAKGFKPTRESCDQCYVAIRASTERGLFRLIAGQSGPGGQHAGDGHGQVTARLASSAPSEVTGVGMRPRSD